MWPDRPVDLAGVSVDEPCAPAGLLNDRPTGRYVQFHPADCLKAGKA